MELSQEQIRDNFCNINEKIRQAELKAGRSTGTVKLCAVSKFHDYNAVINAVNCGQFLFGENRVQEAHEKFSLLKNDYSIEPELHIIGSLQTNKVKKALEVCSCIQSVDRLDLLLEIEKQACKLNKKVDILFEVHTGEESKSGYESYDDILKSMEFFCDCKFPHINPKGIMTMAPFVQDEKLIRNSFLTARNYYEKLQKEFKDFTFDTLSMGMSGDFEIAISEGSNLVRIGTALFGERIYS